MFIEIPGFYIPPCDSVLYPGVGPLSIDRVPILRNHELFSTPLLFKMSYEENGVTEFGLIGLNCSPLLAQISSH